MKLMVVGSPFHFHLFLPNSFPQPTASTQLTTESNMHPLFTFPLIILFSVNLSTAALSPDGLALLAFKSALSADPSSALSPWAETDPDPSHWPGVSCANISANPNRVVAISISDKNLSGYIPSELGSLVFLRRLNLHGNQLSGFIPSQLFNATSLHSLFLYNNNLSGRIPSSVCDPPRLQNLDLSGNSLSGPLPDFNRCRQLQRLVLSNNLLSGVIPAGIWTDMVGLIQVDLSLNRFEGFLSSDIGDLNSLTGTLNLSHNHFSGPIPESLGRLPPAASLDLSYNNFLGEIPGSLANVGLTAFFDNPYLCGLPLRIPCSKGGNTETEFSPERRKGIGAGLIVVISLADAAGVAIIGLIFVYVYWKGRDRETLSEEECSIKSGENEAGEEGKLVCMEKGFEFELEELFRGSAYVLGRGGMGIVYKVVVGNGIAVAVRRLGEGGGQRYEEFVKEVRGIGKARHPNVVRLRAYYWAQDEKLLISDFISNGNLAGALRGRSGQSNLSWLIRLRIAKGVAHGLTYLHDFSPRKFVHGDIKPSNILLDANYNPFISDFGLKNLITMNVIQTSSSSPGGYIGAALPSSATTTRPALNRPNPYRAPEARMPFTRPTQKCDVYSFGIVLLELLTGRQVETSSSSLIEEKVGGSELVGWVRKMFEKACPLGEIVDPVMLEVRSKELVDAFHVALACTEIDPDVRPRMKIVSENLDRIGR